MSSGKPRRRAPQQLILEQAERAAQWSFVRFPLVVSRFLFVDLAPRLPRSRVFVLTEAGRWQVFAWAAFVTLVLCLVVTGTWSYLSGTFSGSDAQRVYFSDDWHNLVLYAFVCPAYVGFGAVLIATVVSGFWELRQLEDEISREPIELRRVHWRVPALVLFVLAVALTLTSLYIKDVSDPLRVGGVYWFLETLDGGGVRLGPLGVYYFLLNFSLLLFTLVSLAFFMSAFAGTMRVAAALSRRQADPTKPLDFAALKMRLQTFVGAYLAAKLQVAVYILNFWIWEKSPLGRTDNLPIAHFFLVLVGVFFLAIPRHYLELQWARYQRLAPEAAGDDLDVESMLDERAALVAWVVDFLLIGSIFYVPVLNRFLSYQ